MNLKALKPLIMLVALATLLSMAVFMLTSCKLTGASKSNPCPHAAQVKACQSKHVKSHCAAKKEGNPHTGEHPKLGCEAKKEGNPHSSNPAKSCSKTKVEAKTCSEKKESKPCSGDK